MFITVSQIRELSHFCGLADKEIRSDLIHGFIASENDYTSNFTGALRRNINSYSKTGLKAISFTLKPQEERITGADAAIIISNGNTIKVILIEGKWPRLQSPNHHWDSKQTASGLSHFSDQLARQKTYASRYAIVEMFYDEAPFHLTKPYMQQNGSACIWHRDALAHDQQRNTHPNVWNQKDLLGMLTNKTYSISTIVKEVCLCREGQQLNVPSPKLDQIRFNIGDLQLPANVLLITTQKAD